MKIKFIFLILFFSIHISFGQNAKELIEKGNQFFYQKDYSSALKYFQQASSADKSHSFPQAIYNSGNSFYKLKKYDNAIKTYQQFISVSSSNEMKAQAQFNIGNCYLAQDDLVKSISAYEKSLKINPKDADARYNLAYAISKLNGRQKTNQDSEIPNSTPPKKEKKKEAQQNQSLSKEDLEKLMQSLSQAESNTLNKVKPEKTSTRKKKTKNW